MFRLMPQVVKTSTYFFRWAPAGLQVNGRKPIVHGSHSVPVRLLATLTTNKNRQESRIERKLGEYEEYFFKAGREKGWGHIRKCVVIRSKIELAPEQIRGALENIQKRHAILRMAVTLKDGENYFAEVSDAPDFEILQCTDRRAAIASDEQAEWFTFGKLLWRTKLLAPEKTDQGFIYPFIFTYQACIIDGTTMNSNLLPDLLAYLEASCDQNGDNDIESLPILPPREHILNQYPDIQYDQIAPGDDWASQKALAVKLHEMNKPSDPQSCSGLVSFLFDKEQTSQLKKEVAQHSVSLNSVCVAAHAMALYRLLINSGLLTDQGWSLQSPFVVDLRPYMKPQTPVSNSGVFVSELCNKIIIPAKMASSNNNDALWELAASIKKENRELLGKLEHILASIKNSNATFDNMITKDSEAFYRACEPVQDLFYLSMTANDTFPPGAGNVSLDKVELSIGTREPLMFCHSIHRINSSCLLHWELSYSKMLVSDELAETYLSLIKEELERYITR